jgi:hypothetical protein
VTRVAETLFVTSARKPGVAEEAVGEDIAQQGITTSGDGAVVMSCEHGQCSCHLEALAPPNAVVEFHFAATCSSREVMRQLIRNHCLAGMDVEDGSHQTDETPKGN